MPQSARSKLVSNWCCWRWADSPWCLECWSMMAAIFLALHELFKACFWRTMAHECMLGCSGYGCRQVTWQVKFSWSYIKWKSKELSPMFATRNYHCLLMHCGICTISLFSIRKQAADEKSIHQLNVLGQGSTDEMKDSLWASEIQTLRLIISEKWEELTGSTYISDQ